ncbi:MULTISPECIES: 3-isopropylmalate dehydratase small subunit [Halomonadaceae]|uniref:3-isopropylmalate dehydratase small subunit n=1 Tax=Halomonadaceae TaxID=28256 RepID=UPI00159998C4|nr:MULTISPECIES: 3-isopropylmalate dehydratase small subunit [Halomonas]QJQ95679.1 3-isopropylmalate dehydratase small subunit [Halomonas sp. PA5]
MKPVTQVESPALLLLDNNIDTDQIIPARFLRKPRSSGYHHYLLYDARYDMHGQPLPESPIPEPTTEGEPGSAKIVLAGHNIGCGSSREGAVYAFVDYGIQVIISTKIADIFRNNAIRNGLLPIMLDQAPFDELVAHCQTNPQASLVVDLDICTIRWGNDRGLSFEIDAGSRERLLKGIDDIQATLSREQQIRYFATRLLKERPWTIPAKPMQ